VDVDEAGRDDPALGVDHAPGARRVDLAHRGDAVAVHCDIGPSSGCSGAVDDGAAGNDQVVRHESP
jgi:hypothetical protein